MILFSNVSKKVNNEIWLKDLSFKINRNEFVFIYDDNQRILSTLRELLCGGMNPKEGLIRLMNKYQPTAKIFDYEISIIYKDNILLSDRSIRENYNFILGFMGKKRKYNSNRINRILEIVDLKRGAEFLPNDLSPHQLVRANIGQSLLVHPSLVIFDNATLDIDEVNSQAIFHLMEKINRLGITVVFLCSNLKMVSRNKTKRVIYLKEGKILAEKNKGYTG